MYERAVRDHALWDMRLQGFLDHELGESDVEGAGDARRCDLGAWLEAEGRAHSGLPEYRRLCAVHERFHERAGEIVELARRGRSHEAGALLDPGGAYTAAATELTRALFGLQVVAEELIPA